MSMPTGWNPSGRAMRAGGRVEDGGAAVPAGAVETVTARAAVRAVAATAEARAAIGGWNGGGVGRLVMAGFLRPFPPRLGGTWLPFVALLSCPVRSP